MMMMLIIIIIIIGRRRSIMQLPNKSVRCNSRIRTALCHRHLIPYAPVATQNTSQAV